MQMIQSNIRPKKILIFSLFYYPKHIGGAEVAIKEITDRISPEEIEFDMITLNDGQPMFESIGNINVYRVGFGGLLGKVLYPFLAYLKSKELYIKNNYESVWSMMASYAGLAGYLFKSKFKESDLIISLQEGDNFERREGMLKFIFKKILSKADYIQVISKFLEDWAIKMGAKCSITIIPNGVNVNFFSNRMPHAELEIFKRNLGKKVDDVFLITSSRLVKKNATQDTIDALQYLPENIKFLILGKGYQENSLKEQVRRLGLESRVKFFGFVPHADMPKYLHVSDIFIRPSLSEGFGNSYIEAMAAGIPVIATPVGGILDFLIDGKTGLFCETSNPKSIAQKIEKLIKDKESREYIVKNAYEMVKNQYDWNLVASDMKNKVFLR